jgi:hypothetical protein
VRVLTAAGEPASEVFVAASRSAATPVDEAGCVLLKRCVAGASRLRVFGAGKLLLEQTIHVTPGGNPEVVVHLP